MYPELLPVVITTNILAHEITTLSNEIAMHRTSNLLSQRSECFR